MMKVLTLVAMIGVVAATMLVGSSWSQQVASDPFSQPQLAIPTRSDLDDHADGRAVAPARTTTAINAITEDLFGTTRVQLNTGYHDPRAAARSEVDKIMQQLRATDSDAKKAEFTKQLETAVSNQFDEDLKHREGELDKLVERVAKLRAQLDRRRKAKAEITQLQTKVLVNDADGLGFSDPWPSTGRSNSVTISPFGEVPTSSQPDVYRYQIQPVPHPK